MGVHTVLLTIRMAGGTQVENITKSVADALTGSPLKAGIVMVFVKHTTASVMIIEDEPGIRADTKTFWDRLVPPDPGCHLRGQLQGPSVTIPFAAGALLLGTWQQIVLVDFDTRARVRELVVQVLGE
jgi:secondary thiamine-phosphate synthase enzyme